MAKIKGGRFGTMLVWVLVVAVLALAVGVGIARYGDRVTWLSPVLGQPTQDSETVVQGIQRLNELTTVRYTTQVVVVEEENERIFMQPLPEFLTGEKVLLVAVGEVEAGIDLDELGQEDIRVDGERVTIDLPQPRILDSSIDEDKTKLYDRDRGLLGIRGNDALIEEARRDGEGRMVESARQNGIVQQAQNNAEESIRTFVSSLGYEEVAFT